MTSDNFCFYLPNRQIQTSQTGGQWYSDTFPFSIPWSKWTLKSCNTILIFKFELHVSIHVQTRHSPTKSICLAVTSQRAAWQLDRKTLQRNKNLDRVFNSKRGRMRVMRLFFFFTKWPSLDLKT